MTQPKLLKDLLKDFKPREEYFSKEIADCLDYKDTRALQRPVTRDDGIMLLVKLTKNISNTKRKNKLGNSLLSWVGQPSHRTDQDIVNTKKKGKYAFLFCRYKGGQKFTYYGPIKLIDHKLNKGKEPSYFKFKIEELNMAKRYLKATTPDSDPLCTQRDARGTVRVGQGRFREHVRELWEESCSVTHLKNSDRLNLWASHIKPWRDCSNKERLDRYNGLLLIPNLERLFDSGFITFEKESGKIIISNKLKPRQRQLLGVRPNMKLRKVPRETRKYLEYHRHNLFENWEATTLD